MGREKKKKKKKRRSRSRDRGRRADRGPFGAGVKVALGEDESSSDSSFREASSSRDRQLQLLEYSAQAGCRLVFCRRCERCSHGTGGRCTLQRGGTGASSAFQLPLHDHGPGVPNEAGDQAAERAEDPLPGPGPGCGGGGAASRRHPRPEGEGRRGRPSSSREVSFWRPTRR